MRLLNFIKYATNKVHRCSGMQVSRTPQNAGRQRGNPGRNRFPQEAKPGPERRFDTILRLIGTAIGARRKASELDWGVPIGEEYSAWMGERGRMKGRARALDGRIRALVLEEIGMAQERCGEWITAALDSGSRTENLEGLEAIKADLPALGYFAMKSGQEYVRSECLGELLELAGSGVWGTGTEYLILKIMEHIATRGVHPDAAYDILDFLSKKQYSNMDNTDPGVAGEPSNILLRISRIADDCEVSSCAWEHYHQFAAINGPGEL